MYRADASQYSGAWHAHPAHFHGWGHPVPHGYCRRCGQSSGGCHCGCRECRKESKELLVLPARDDQDSTTGIATGRTGASLLRLMVPDGADDKATVDTSNAAAVAAAARAIGIAEGYVGGGCCVSLSVEYTPSSPTVQATVGVIVQDGEGTVLSWVRTEQPGTGYRVRECVITTNPGARLLAAALNATARVRWCEIFSC